jgi:hypothetical protein
MTTTSHRRMIATAIGSDFGFMDPDVVNGRIRKAGGCEDPNLDGRPIDWDEIARHMM